MELEEQLSNRTWHLPRIAGSRQTGYCAVSSGISGVVVYPSPHPRSATTNRGSNKSSSSSSGAHEAGIIHSLTPTSWLFSRHTRQLVNEAVGTFRSLQAAVAEAGGITGGDGAAEGDADLTPVLIKKSREYRSMLQACVCSMNTTLEVLPPDGEEARQLVLQCQLLYKMELVLGLTEIIFVDARPGGLILNQLVCWVRLHYPSCTEQMVQVMAADDPTQHTLYWETVYGLVCQGRLSDVRQMLGQHASSSTDAFAAMDEILRKMPTFQVYSGVTEGEYLLRWQHWQAECESRLQRGDFSAWSHLNKVAEILCGNSQSILSITALSSEYSTWLPHLLATLLYTQPAIKLHRLHAAALQAIDECNTRLSALDELLLGAMEGDAGQVVRGCQQALDNLWLSAHLTDLLHHALSRRQHQSLEGMRDQLVQDYALELADHHSLWQVGVIYLDYCGSGGVAGSEPSPLTPLLLERVVLTNDAKAQKLINIAAQRGLDTVVSGVCRVMGRRAGAEGRLAAAIWWGVRARDAAFTDHTAHQVLHKYLSTGQFQSSALLLDHLGPAMLISDTLTFLGKYREFHSLYQQGDYRQAAALLVTLIASKLAPHYFWPVLLLDALPLLQQPEEETSITDAAPSSSSSGVVVTAAHTYELMYCLNTVMAELDENEKKSKNSISSAAEEDRAPTTGGFAVTLKQKEGELREALATNLARAIVAEAVDTTSGGSGGGGGGGGCGPGNMTANILAGHDITA